jgi:circadian clock protein KaiC
VVIFVLKWIGEKMKRKMGNKVKVGLKKSPTGIKGLDEITEGGLPTGRPTLVCGPAGSGKTLLGMEFIVRGITQFNEPGVYVTFEENADELAANVASLGMNVKELIKQNKLAIDYVRIERSEIEETGEYDLEGLFIRLQSMIEKVGAKRIVLDTVEALFAGLPNEAILRAELRRLFRWLKLKGLTAVITGEQGRNHFTRHNLEEYVSDCVIVLDNRVTNQMATRRLRIVKYRGSRHGTNEYPTMIDEDGLSVLPVSSIGLTYSVTTKRVSTGISKLDEMFYGKGYYAGTTILITGTAGTGKTSISTAFADRICQNGQKCLYFSFEESPEQIMRNMRSIGFDLEKHVRKGNLKFHAVRPTLYGIETHLVSIHKLVDSFNPDAVVVDPITNLTSVGQYDEIKSMMMRMIDFLKNKHITALFTSLSTNTVFTESEVGISSLIDTWISLRNVETDGERNRLLYILKSRGMPHSNQVREFLLSEKGIELRDVYVGPGTVLTGSARLQQESKDKMQDFMDKQNLDRRQRELRQQQLSVNAQIAALKAQSEGIGNELKLAIDSTRAKSDMLSQQAKEVSRSRNENSNERND